MTSPTPEALSGKELAEHAETQTTMLQALDDLFNGANGERVTLPDSDVSVLIFAAKVKHLRLVTAFIQEFLGQFSAEEITQVVALTAQAQTDLIKDGQNPYVNLLSQIKTYVGGIEILLKLTHRGSEMLPRFIPIFTDLTAEQADELDLDHASMIIYAVFGRNYHFFFHKVRPAIQECIALLSKQKKQEKSEPGAST